MKFRKVKEKYRIKLDKLHKEVFKNSPKIIIEKNKNKTKENGNRTY